MNRRDFLKNAGVFAGSVAIMGCESPEKYIAKSSSGKRPNVLFVFPDQMRRHAMGFWNTPGFETNSLADPVITPNLDCFARESVVFPHAISNLPICTPFRAMLLTGKYPYATKMVDNCKSLRPDLELSDDELCISDVLKANGYNMGYIGKWHLDSPVPHHAEGIKGVWDQYTPPGKSRHGFDFWYSYGCYNEHMNPHYWTGDSPEMMKFENKWNVEHETDVAIDFIENKDGNYRDSSKPFALFVSYNPPHTPYEAVPDEWKKLYDGMSIKELLNRPNVDYKHGRGKNSVRKDDDGRLMVQDYFAGVSGVDHHFGRLLKTLKDNGLDEDTIVIFTADHGDMMGSHARMGKTVEYEEALGIPFIMRWPGKLKPRMDNLQMSVPDIYPTVLSLAGLKSEIPAEVQGIDHSQTLLGKSDKKPKSAFWQHYNQGEGVYIPEDYWKYGYRGVRTERYTYGMYRGKDGSAHRYLYDNVKDPYQMTKICDGQGYDDIMNELDAELAKHLKHIGETYKAWCH